MRQGEAALRARDRRTATEALQAAGEIAGPLGAQPLADDVERAAARGRLVLDDASRAAAGAAAVPPRAGERGLTAREVEVLRLLLDGRSNRQVARTLGMSEKTASVHVSRILTKLGVSTRGEAAAAATRLRLLEP